MRALRFLRPPISLRRNFGSTLARIEAAPAGLPCPEPPPCLICLPCNAMPEATSRTDWNQSQEGLSAPIRLLGVTTRRATPHPSLLSTRLAALTSAFGQDLSLAICLARCTRRTPFSRLLNYLSTPKYTAGIASLSLVLALGSRALRQIRTPTQRKLSR